MSGNILVLCDTEEEYAQHMTEYLKAHREAPLDIYTYTDVEEMISFAKNIHIDILVVAENAYTQKVRDLAAESTILLNESGVIRWEHIRNVNKYQAAEEVYKEILGEYMEMAGHPLPRLATESDTRLIGFFSPIRQSLQTTFALTMGQMLSQKYKTLYLNFEYCAGNAELLPDMRTRDISDLIYFLNTDKDRLLLRMQTIVQKKGRMDYIPPVKAGMTLLEVREEEWIELLTRIARSGEYKYIILDLSESVRGLLELLRVCDKIYTLTKDGRSARGKLAQYERLLEMAECDEVLKKTSRYCLPRFRKIPDEIELLTKGEMADYVKRIMGEVTYAASLRLENETAGKGIGQS